MLDYNSVMLNIKTSLQRHYMSFICDTIDPAMWEEHRNGKRKWGQGSACTKYVSEINEQPDCK